MGQGRAAKLRLTWVTHDTPPTGHPYRAAQQRPRVACGASQEVPGRSRVWQRRRRPLGGGGVNPGSSGFCANPAANAANRKHPFRKRIAPSTTPAAKTAISKHPSETHSVSKTPPTSSTQCDQSFSSNSTTSPIHFLIRIFVPTLLGRSQRECLRPLRATAHAARHRKRSNQPGGDCGGQDRIVLWVGGQVHQRQLCKDKGACRDRLYNGCGFI